MSSLLRATLWLVLTVVVFFILHIGKDLIVPFVLAIFIWYLINVLSISITKIGVRGLKIPASLRYIASALVILAGLGLLFNFITQNVAKVRKAAPEYQDRIQPLIDKAYSYLPFEQPPSLSEFVAQFDFSGIVSNLASTLASLAGNASIISIYVMFLFLEQRSLPSKLKAMTFGGMEDKEIGDLVEQIGNDIRTYVGIKTFTSALTGLISYGIMATIGLDFAAFWGVLIFFLNFIPTIGSILATIFPAMLSLVVFTTPLPIIGVIGGVTATQLLVGNFIEPRLMGNTLNLSPMVILLSLSLWGSLWGIVGMFLCVPITVIGMIVCSHFEQTRHIAILLSSNGQIKGAKPAEDAAA